ncbi:hypothetical protein [Photobacterium rosenbergii]|uniref:hypothetical protein n=1 Tax=Photobacterium rosenbergii TaxID=294936 RepID=UPI001C98FA3F|nr:hypothetical protein [Photobacterium rosenbergii]MBY5949286.1 hypothetical protein [Photobacterium rosenbergii]
MGVLRQVTKEDRLVTGSKEFTSNQLSLLILYNMVKKALRKNQEIYKRFRMRESQISELNQKPLTPETRWALIEGMNILGYEVAINHKYWVFTKSTLTDRWPAFNIAEIEDLVVQIRALPQNKEMGCLGEEKFFNHDADDLDLFYNGQNEFEFDFDDEELGLDNDDFSIWQHIYFHLEHIGIIDDPLLLGK